MRKSLLALISSVVLSAAFGCVIAAMAQQRPPIVGGYKEASPKSADVIAAARFAVGERARKRETKIKLISVEHAESQVVAGINYRLCLKVEVAGEEDEADVIQEVKVVVFRSLKKQYSLKSWEEEACGEDQRPQPSNVNH
ncbi:MAG TPA: cystatin domain-containing protein [Pyrinomonadaceae bacterium]|jgi:hypothetical protein